MYEKTTILPNTLLQIYEVLIQFSKEFCWYLCESLIQIYDFYVVSVQFFCYKTTNNQTKVIHVDFSNYILSKLIY